MTHYSCPTCGRLHSEDEPTDVWCLHTGRFIYRGPVSTAGAGWSQMEVLDVEWRAAAADAGSTPDFSNIVGSRAQAWDALERMTAETAGQPYDSAWIERRAVGPWVAYAAADGPTATFTTASGRVLTNDDIERLADEEEQRGDAAG